MSIIPPDFYSDKDNPFSLPESCVLSFLAHVKINVGISGTTACNYLSGVRFMLLNSNIDIAFMDRSNAIKTTRAGMHLMDRAESKEADTKRLPLTCEMIVYGKDVMYNARKQSRRHRTSHRFLLSRTSQQVHPHERYILSMNAHLYSNDEVIGVIYTLRDAKNDPDGTGYTIPFDRNRSPDAALTSLASLSTLYSLLVSKEVHRSFHQVLEKNYFTAAC